MATPNRFQGCTAVIIVTVLILVVLIVTVIGTVFNSAVSGTLILIGFTVAGVFVPLIVWVIEKAFKNVDQWFDRCDDKLWDTWTRLMGTRSSWQLQVSQATFRLTVSVILLFAIIIIFILLPALPQSVHALLFHPPVSVSSCSICVDPKTHAGISDGQYRFWSDNDPQNAEKLIYEANYELTHQPYLVESPHATIVVVTTLDPYGRNLGVGHDTLQAASVLQREANGLVDNQGNDPDSCVFPVPPSCLRVRLLVANAGDTMEFATTVALQIVQIAKSDPTFVGVIGWPISTSTGIDGLHILARFHIPVISSTASSDALTAISPYFFRINPVDSEQGPVGALYVENTFQDAHNILIFYTPDNPYSLTLATGFIHQFTQVNNNHVSFETFNLNDKSSDVNIEILNGIKKAFAVPGKPDLIYFAGYSEDLSKMQAALKETGHSDIAVMSGDGAYDLGGYKGLAYHNLSFTAFASPDEWGQFIDPCMMGSKIPKMVQTFFCDYRHTFDPQNQHPKQYGSSRADATVMLTYDATYALVNAYQATNKPQPKADDIRQALQSFNVCYPLQGVSGAIAFGPDGNPINKVIVLLTVNSTGETSFIGIAQGQLFAAKQQSC